ncbi:Hypothetical predicted protein [Pelobates cultripes]|uniref:Uncharacterized protein n=1 Tax=Pelobates cultripes TaxID=61616 RepID=A0AAD1T888_PELCU|nr:Hypothetical predicted protein [Pelobates cultripes]
MTAPDRCGRLNKEMHLSKSRRITARSAGASIPTEHVITMDAGFCDIGGHVGSSEGNMKDLLGAPPPDLPCHLYAAHDDVTRRRSHGNARVSVAVTPPPSRTAARHLPELQSGAIRNGRSAPTPALSPAAQLILSLLESSEL